MNIVQHRIGHMKRNVSIVYWVEEGAFDGFYVLTPEMVDIASYLDLNTLEDLEEVAQRHYMEQAVNKNEQEIINCN